jgi:hypothetical protein
VRYAEYQARLRQEDPTELAGTPWRNIPVRHNPDEQSECLGMMHQKAIRIRAERPEQGSGTHESQMKASPKVCGR